MKYSEKINKLNFVYFLFEYKNAFPFSSWGAITGCFFVYSSSIFSVSCILLSLLLSLYLSLLLSLISSLFFLSYYVQCLFIRKIFIISLYLTTQRASSLIILIHR